MSVFIIHLLPQGIIFAADRNITINSVYQDREQLISINNYGQTQSSKVLKWPNNKAIIGAVGAATLGGIPINEWFYNFIGSNINFSNFNELAKSLKDSVESQRLIDDSGNEPQAMVIHLGGFEKKDDIWVPVIYFIRNADIDSDGNYICSDFVYGEEVGRIFQSLKPNEIKQRLKELSEKREPFWIHHEIGLKTFNLLDAFIKNALNIIYTNNIELSFPATLNEWEKHAKMIVLTYEAYFQAFKDPWEQYVGGGVDVLSLPWPK